MVHHPFRLILPLGHLAFPSTGTASKWISAKARAQCITGPVCLRKGVIHSAISINRLLKGIGCTPHCPWPGFSGIPLWTDPDKLVQFIVEFAGQLFILFPVGIGRPDDKGNRGVVLPVNLLGGLGPALRIPVDIDEIPEILVLFHRRHHFLPGGLIKLVPFRLVTPGVNLCSDSQFLQ